MPNSINFYEGIFLHVIPVRITVPCLHTGSPRDTPEGKWVLGGGIEIPCIKKSVCYGRIDQKSYLHKKK